MKNFRKTRKRGGFQYTPNVYECGTKTVRGVVTKVPVSECIRDFAAANNFTIVATADDGNCFYDTLSKYGARTRNPRLNKTHMELRREIIGNMIAHQADYAPYFVADQTVSPEGNVIAVDVAGELRRFLQSRQWVGWMGDIVPQVASNILGVNIIIYDLLVNEPSNSIDRIEIHPIAGPAGTTVNMLRTGGSHFRLLWPRGAAAGPGAAAAAAVGGPGRAPTPPRAPTPGKATARRRPVVAPNSRATAKKTNVVTNTAKALANMKLGNKELGTGPATRSRARATVKRSVSRTGSNSGANSSFERNMRRAIEASKRVDVVTNEAKKEAARAKIAAKKAEEAAIKAAKKATLNAKKAAKQAKNNAERQEADNLQAAIAASLASIQPSSFLNK